MNAPTIQEIGNAFQRLTNIENSDTDRDKAIIQMKSGDSKGLDYAEHYCRRILDFGRGTAKSAASRILADIINVRGKAAP